MSIEGINSVINYVRRFDINFNNEIERDVAAEREAYEADVASDLNQDGRITAEENLEAYQMACFGDALAITTQEIATQTAILFNHDIYDISARIEAAEILANMGQVDPVILAFNTNENMLMPSGGGGVDYDINLKPHFLESIADILVKTIGEEEALEVFYSALHHEDGDVRRAAIYGMNKIQSSAKVDYFIKALSDTSLNFYAREDIIESLAECRDARALEPLISLIENLTGEVTYAWKSWMLAQSAIEALSDLRDYSGYETNRRIADCLLRVLNYNFDDTAYLNARSQAVSLLGELGDERAVEPLLNLLESLLQDPDSDPFFWRRENVIMALGHFSSNPKVEAVLLVLANTTNAFSSIARRALGIE